MSGLMSNFINVKKNLLKVLIIKLIVSFSNSDIFWNK